MRLTEIVNGAEWVSTGLTRLDINLLADVDQETAEGMAKARIAFKQLEEKALHIPKFKEEFLQTANDSSAISLTRWDREKTESGGIK
ncbi:hypothetical protein BX616_001335 [Lobosporangium transversale]|nr:hypothetical protein BX616_001335 [Lobosporangium transversale]